MERKHNIAEMMKLMLDLKVQRLEEDLKEWEGCYEQEMQWRLELHEKLKEKEKTLKRVQETSTAERLLHLAQQRDSQAKHTGEMLRLKAQHSKALENQLEKQLEDVRVRLKDSLVMKEGKKIRLVLKEAGKKALISSVVQ